MIADLSASWQTGGAILNSALDNPRNESSRSALRIEPNATHGLRENDIIAFLCAPGRDISRVKKEVVDYLPTQAWYLHQSTDGRLFFRDIQNLAAKLHATARQYNDQTCLRELRGYLEGLFQPQLSDCYQRLAALIGVDEVQLDADRTTLVLVQPSATVDQATKLPVEWTRFHADQTFKNRVLYLTGAQETLSHVLEQAAQYKAIHSIFDEMDTEGVAPRDPQRRQASQNLDQITLRLRAAIQETFTTLVYPSMGQLRATDCRPVFDNNQFDGERLIRDTLVRMRKFEPDTGNESFRRKAESRLFQNQKSVCWNEIKYRAATNDAWPLHRADALDGLRRVAENEGHWGVLGDAVEMGPFPPPRTEVQVRQLSRDPSTGEVHLKITPLHQLRVILKRTVWEAIAEEVKAELNRRLRALGLKTGKWLQAGQVPIDRTLGKELCVLAWAVEDCDPALIPTAIRNWLGLVPEERWWLYTMTNAATGHAIQGRGKGWRKAVRFALSENPISATLGLASGRGEFRLTHPEPE